MKSHTSTDSLSPFTSKLFFDDTWVADSIRVSRTWHSAQKLREPVLLPNATTEENAIVGYGSVLYFRNRFHLWYITWTRRTPLRVAYACSDDGMNFIKPELGLYEIAGSKANNVCLMAEPVGDIDSVSVILDDEDAEYPFKAVFWQGLGGPRDKTGMPAERGISTAKSRDGMHWEKHPGFALPRWGDRMSAMASRVDGKFVLYGRPENFLEPYQSRTVFRTESDDLLRWSEPVPVAKSGLEDPPMTEAYSLQAFPYAGWHLGMLERMHGAPDVVDTELVFSKDSLDWRHGRMRSSFLPIGQPGSWDCAWTNVISGSPILHRNSLFFYYGGRSSAHKTLYPLNRAAIGLAVLRPDGFVSLQAANREGWFTTPVMAWPDNADLGLNGDPRADLSIYPGFASGEIRVEVLDPEGTCLPGFSRDESLSVTFTTLHEPGHKKRMLWQGGRSLKELGGKRLSLKVHLRDAHLFSFSALPLDENSTLHAIL